MFNVQFIPKIIFFGTNRVWFYDSIIINPFSVLFCFEIDGIYWNGRLHLPVYRWLNNLFFINFQQVDWRTFSIAEWQCTFSILLMCRSFNVNNTPVWDRKYYMHWKEKIQSAEKTKSRLFIHWASYLFYTYFSLFRSKHHA